MEICPNKCAVTVEFVPTNLDALQVEVTNHSKLLALKGDGSERYGKGSTQ
jgi:hypothetical protein